MSSTPIGVRLTVPHNERLRRLAAEQGLKPTQLVRTAVIEFLDRHAQETAA